MMLLHVPAKSAVKSSEDMLASVRSLLFIFSNAWFYASRTESGDNENHGELGVLGVG